MWFISWNNYCITKGPLHWPVLWCCKECWVCYNLQSHCKMLLNPRHLIFKPVQTLHKEWCVTCRVGQCESNGFSCDVDSDIFQRFIYYKGKGLLLPRAPCSLKNCHLMESGGQEEQHAWIYISTFQTGPMKEDLALASEVAIRTALSYQSWCGCVKDDICGLRQLFLGHLDGLASRGQSQVLVVFKACSSEGTTMSGTTPRHEKWHLWRSFDVEINCISS